MWRVEIPSSRLLYLPAIRETGGGSEGTYYGSTDDGFLYASSSNYATAQGASTGAASTGEVYVEVGQFFSDSTYWVYRAVVFFATGDLPDNATVAIATLGLYGYADQSDTDFDVTVVSFAGSQPPVGDDYNDFGTTSYGTLSTSGFTVGAYNFITLNAAGRAAINRRGNTALGMRSSRDISATTPTGKEYVFLYSADEAGTGKDPKLTVVYYAPRGGVGVGNPMIFS